MSTSPESIRDDDRIVNSISRWLARHISGAELGAELEAVDLEQLGSDQAEAVLELQNELQVATERAGVEMVARETMETVALGG
jgi:hypothetical protein